MQWLCILPFGILCLSAIRKMFVNIFGESELCVFGKLCPVSFLVVCECSSVLSQSVVMSYIDCGNDGWVVR